MSGPVQVVHVYTTLILSHPRASCIDCEATVLKHRKETEIWNRERGEKGEWRGGEGGEGGGGRRGRGEGGEGSSEHNKTDGI